MGTWQGLNKYDLVYWRWQCGLPLSTKVIGKFKPQAHSMTPTKIHHSWKKQTPSGLIFLLACYTLKPLSIPTESQCPTPALFLTEIYTTL